MLQQIDSLLLCDQSAGSTLTRRYDDTDSSVQVQLGAKTIPEDETKKAACSQVSGTADDSLSSSDQTE